MAAFTEAYQSTDGQKNHLGDAISMVMAARRMAEVERDRAEDLAERNQTSLEEAGIEKDTSSRQHCFIPLVVIGLMIRKKRSKI